MEAIGRARSSSLLRGVAVPQQQERGGQAKAKRVSFVQVRAEVSETSKVALNPSVKKEIDKVVDTVVVSELAKPLTAYCRCWRSGIFPLCDGAHAKYNKATGDNVGPLLVKK